MRIRIPNDFTPRAYQRRFMAYFDAGGKRAVWVVHRRGGKDLTALHQTCKMMHARPGTYWHVFPTSEQGRKAIWEGFTKDGKRIMEQVFPAAIRKSPREFLPKAEMVVELNCGAIWRLLGSDKIETVGAGPFGVVFSEYSIAKPRAWNLIRPMMRENEGWAAFIFTPRGNNHGKKLYDTALREPGWFCDLRTLFDTRAYDPEGTIAAERAEGMPEALIRQEYLCDWTAANVGSVWGDLLERLEKTGKLAAFEHPSDGVFTSWDLGISDATAIWFWRLGPFGVDMIDHYEAHGKPISHYVDELRARGYRYVKHWVPHDARQRSLQTGIGTLEQLESQLGNVDVGPPMSLPDGLQAGRWLLQQGIRIHARCEQGIEALKAYSYEWDDDRKVFSSKPQHDWSSHSADAFRYLALVAKHSEQMMAKPAPPPELKILSASEITMDDLWKMHEADLRRRNG